MKTLRYKRERRIRKIRGISKTGLTHSPKRLSAWRFYRFFTSVHSLNENALHSACTSLIALEKCDIECSPLRELSVMRGPMTMNIKDVIGLVLCAVGIGIAIVGYRLLGLTWFWIGVAFDFVGLLLVLNEVRERKLLHELRYGRVAGDYGDRHYFSGSSSNDFSDSTSSDGGGGD